MATFCEYLLFQDVDVFRYGCAVIWSIWKARNALVFSDKLSSVDFVLEQAKQLFNDFKSVEVSFDSGIPTPSHHQTIAAPRWALPPINFIKINVDGACNGGRIAAGAVARDHHGHFLGCMTRCLGFGSPIEAEASAFNLGLELLHNLELNHVIIEGDAKSVVDSINNSSLSCDWRTRQSILNCRSVLSQRQDITYSYSSRETNGVAHALASFAITHEVNDVWSGGLPPPFILDHLFLDLAFIVSPIST